MRRRYLFVAVALVLGIAAIVGAQSQFVPNTWITGTLLQFGGTTSSFPALKTGSASKLVVRLADDSADTLLQASDLQPSSAFITAGSGTGVTLLSLGKVETTVYKVTVASTNFIAAAVTADVTLATLPAKTAVAWMIADVTQTFACSATCTTSTLSMTCGKTAGGNEYLASFDADAAAAQFGDAQGELGTALKTATPPSTPIGDMPSWSATTAVQCRLTSGTGNIGTGVATNLSQGSITFYLVTTRMP